MNEINKKNYEIEAQNYESLKAFLEENGYYSLVHLSDKTVAGLQDYIFTTGLVTGLTEHTYAQRFCYEHKADAVKALGEYKDMSEDAVGPWIKAKGLEFGDRVNPAWSQADDKKIAPPCLPSNLRRKKI